MEERQVTVDGTTYPLKAPFIVMATQNPIEMEGTYPLPEGQRDRFMARISMGYPSPRASTTLLDSHGAHSPLEHLSAVTDADTINRVVAAVTQVHASPAVRQYIVDLVTRSRSTTALRLGASPRAGLHLLRAARAQAALEGRDHVIPDDVQSLAVAVLSHRLMPSSETQLARPDDRRGRHRPAAAGAGAVQHPVSRDAFASGLLTTRGRAFVGAGLTLSLAGIIFGFQDLTRFGVLLVALPYISALLVRTRKTRMRIERHSTGPDQRRPGRARRPRLRERLDDHDARLPRGGAARLRSRRPPAVRRRPHPARRVRIIDYTVGRTCAAATTSGRSPSGQDPFGLANRNAVLEGTADLVILPQVHPLSASRQPRLRRGLRGELAHLIALHGEDDVTIREYRDGDDLRRIHWPATARTGDLMVRQEDRPAQRRAVVLLDPRPTPTVAAGPPARSSGPCPRARPSPRTCASPGMPFTSSAPRPSTVGGSPTPSDRRDPRRPGRRRSVRSRPRTCCCARPRDSPPRAASSSRSSVRAATR